MKIIKDHKKKFKIKGRQGERNKENKRRQKRGNRWKEDERKEEIKR